MHSALFILFLGDIFAAIAALIIAFIVRFMDGYPLQELLKMGISRVLLFIFVVLFTSFFSELYNRERFVSIREIAARILGSLLGAFFILTSFYYFVPSTMYGRGLLVISLLFFAVIQFAWHSGYSFISNLLGFSQRILILGTGPLARQIAALIATTKNSYTLAGFVNCACEPISVPIHEIVGNDKSIYETVLHERAQKIVVSLTERRGVFPLQDVLSCKLSGILVVDSPSFYEQLTGKLLLENITPSWFIFSHGFKVTVFFRIYKRAIDIMSAIIGLILTIPFFPIIALLIKLDSPGSVFFRQVRVGEREKNFVLYKFRTMCLDAESKTGAMWSEKNDPRITTLGRFLRKSRLDEIPQLINVLKGDMSLVGPRPERPEFVNKLKEIIPSYSERHFIKPGITGWAQVRYSYGSSVEDAIEKLRYDLFYIKNISLVFDFMIMLETIKVVLAGRGGR
jgi:sugar transferase (PEP-CTERM system associated)